MASQLKCYGSVTHAIAIGFEIALQADAAAKNAANLIAAEIQASFSGALPALNLRDTCHGTVRIPPHGATPARPAQPVILAPDSACTHSGAQLSSQCLPLWKVELFRGACAHSTDAASNASVPTGPAVGAAADVQYASRAVDLFKSTCRQAFPGFPQGWRHNYCARFSAYVCASRGPQTLRLELEAGGAAAVPASLLLDGNVVLHVASDGAVATGAASLRPQAAEHVADAIVTLQQGCHRLEAIFDEPPEGAKLANGQTALVRRAALCMHQFNDTCILNSSEKIDASRASDTSCLDRQIDPDAVACRPLRCPFTFAGPALEHPRACSAAGRGCGAWQQASAGEQQQPQDLPVP